MERKDGARKNILIVAALSGGEICREVAGCICNTNTYFKRIMTEMKKNEEAEIIKGIKPRTIAIRRNGLDVIVDDVPHLMEMYADGRLRHRKELSERKAVVSQTMYNAQLVDMNIYPLEKPVFFEDGKVDIKNKGYSFYTPLELKYKRIDELQLSRAHGFITGEGRLFFVYNVKDKNIRYRKRSELVAQTHMSKLAEIIQVEKIFFCEGFSMIENIARNNKVQEEWGYKKELDIITPSVGGYIVPNGPQGSIYLKLILYPKVVERVKEIALKREKKEIVNCLTLTLETCRRIIKEEKEVVLLCTEEQKEYLEKLNGNLGIGFCTIKKSLLEEIMEEHIRKLNS